MVLGPEGVTVAKFESVPENLLYINQAWLPVDRNLTYSGDPVLQKDTLHGRRFSDEGKEGQWPQSVGRFQRCRQPCWGVFHTLL